MQINFMVQLYRTEYEHLIKYYVLFAQRHLQSYGRDYLEDSKSFFRGTFAFEASVYVCNFLFFFKALKYFLCRFQCLSQLIALKLCFSK